MNDLFFKKILYGIVILILIITSIFYLTWNSEPDIASPVNYQKAQPDSIDQTLTPRQNLSGYFLKVIVVTVLILGIIIIGAKWYGKLNNAGNSSSGIKILARNHIGTKQQIILVKIEGKKLLLGVTENNINLISDMGVSDEEEDSKYEKAQEYPRFSDFLKQLRKDKNE